MEIGKGVIAGNTRLLWYQMPDANRVQVQALTFSNSEGTTGQWMFDHLDGERQLLSPPCLKLWKYCCFILFPLVLFYYKLYIIDRNIYVVLINIQNFIYFIISRS